MLSCDFIVLEGAKLDIVDDDAVHIASAIDPRVRAG